MSAFKFRAGEFARGTALAAALLAAAFALARFGFKHDYYFAILIPLGMIGCLLVAWGLYLKDDGFIKKQAVSPERTAAGELSVPRPGDAAQISDMRAADKTDTSEKLLTESESGRPDVSMFAPRDNTLVSRADHRAERQGVSAPSRPTRRILLWAAAELALAASLLYALAGVGTKFFG